MVGIGEPRRGILAATVGVWALLASGGAIAADNRTEADPRLYEAVYRAISAHYLEPLSPETLAMAGLNKLRDLDNSLSVSRDGKSLILRQYRDTVLDQNLPGADDSRGWGEATSAILNAARGRSGAIGAVTEERVDETVINGTITLLDRFSRYAPPSQATERRDVRDGYGGIGITLDPDVAEAKIAMVMPDSPASGAGLATGDRITAIDGVEAHVMSRDDIVHKLRGPVGSDVHLTLARAGAPDPLRVTLRRSQIVLRSVTMTHDDHVAVVAITNFNARTADNLAEALAQAHREIPSDKFDGIVLDLRGDPGGLLDQSVRVASLFLESGVVVSTAGRVMDSRQMFEVDRRMATEHLPLVVLVNGGSASASEIVASALQDNGRAVLVGTSSFGKGTVQNVVHLPNQGELTVTWARLVPPGGYILHEHGVVPAVCTANVTDPARVQPAAGPPRISLDDAGWQKLRQACPADRTPHDIDLQVAKQILTDPARYERMVALEPPPPPKTVRAAAVAVTYR